MVDSLVLQQSQPLYPSDFCGVSVCIYDVPALQVLTEERVREVALWCKNNNVLLLADEVYQENVWSPNAR